MQIFYKTNFFPKRLSKFRKLWFSYIEGRVDFSQKHLQSCKQCQEKPWVLFSDASVCLLHLCVCVCVRVWVCVDTCILPDEFSHFHGSSDYFISGVILISCSAYALSQMLLPLVTLLSLCSRLIFIKTLSGSEYRAGYQVGLKVWKGKRIFALTHMLSESKPVSGLTVVCFFLNHRLTRSFETFQLQKSLV